MMITIHSDSESNSMASLTQSPMRQTSRLNEANVANEQGLKLPPPLAFTAPSAPWRLLLQIGEENIPALRVEFVNQLTIGRADLPDGYVPELDLTSYAALDNGISRRNPLMYAMVGMLHLPDLCST